MLKFATFASLLSVSYGFTLSAKSDDQDIDGKQVLGYHEGAGIDYAFLGDKGVDFTLDGETLSFSPPGAPYAENMAVSEDSVITLSPKEKGSASFDGDVLSLDGSDSFYACHDVKEMSGYTYSKTDWAITQFKGDAPDGCKAMKLVKSGDDSSDSSEPTSSAAPEVQTENGAYRNTAGALGVVAAAALLI